MTRVNSTGKESGSNFSPDNGTGLAVRTAIKDIFESLRTVNSAAGDPSGAANLATYQLHINTSNAGATPPEALLKIYNGSSFVTLGNVLETNFGFLSASGDTMTGALLADDAGTASAPAISFDGDTDLGLFRKSANVMGFSASGTEHLFLDQNGITLNSENEIRFGDSDSSNYVGIKAPATVSSSNKTITLPDETGTLLTSASSIANSNLANSSVTVGSTAINLGASATTVSGLTTLTSTNLQATNIKDTSGNNSSTTEQIAQGRAKAWATINGDASPASLRDSFNISSVTYNSTDETFTLVFTNAMPNANYAVVFGSHGFNAHPVTTGAIAGDNTTTTRKNTTGVTVKFGVTGGTNSSGFTNQTRAATQGCVVIFGD